MVYTDTMQSDDIPSNWRYVTPNRNNLMLFAVWRGYVTLEEDRQ